MGDRECGVGAGFGGSGFQMQGAWLRCMGGVLVKGVGFKVSVWGCGGRVLLVSIVWGSVLECKEDQFWRCRGQGISLGRSRFQGLTSHNSRPCSQRRGPRRLPARASAPRTAPRCRRQPGQGPPSARSRPLCDTSDPGIGQRGSGTLRNPPSPYRDPPPSHQGCSAGLLCFIKPPSTPQPPPPIGPPYSRQGPWGLKGVSGGAETPRDCPSPYRQPTPPELPPPPPSTHVPSPIGTPLQIP